MQQGKIGVTLQSEMDSQITKINHFPRSQEQEVEESTQPVRMWLLVVRQPVLCAERQLRGHSFLPISPSTKECCYNTCTAPHGLN